MSSADMPNGKTSVDQDSLGEKFPKCKNKLLKRSLICFEIKVNQGKIRKLDFFTTWNNKTKIDFSSKEPDSKCPILFYSVFR